MTTRITRRTAIALAGAAGPFGATARQSSAAEPTLNVLCHRVHRLCLTTGIAGDLTRHRREKDDAGIIWSTFDTDPLENRLFREASLGHTDFAVCYLVNSRATPDAGALLQPLDAYRAKLPIEAFPDFAPGLVQTMLSAAS